MFFPSTHPSRASSWAYAVTICRATVSPSETATNTPTRRIRSAPPASGQSAAAPPRTAMNSRRPNDLTRMVSQVQQRHHLVGRLHIGEDAGHGLEFGLVRITAHLGHRIRDQDHAIIVLDPAAHGRRYAHTSGYARYDAGGDTQVAQDRVERRVREPTIAFLDDQMFTVAGFELVDDLRTPAALDDEGAVPAVRQPEAPIGKLRVGIVGLQNLSDIDDGPTRLAESIGETLYLGDGAHQKRHVDPGFGHLPRAESEPALGMHEVVLHIDDDQRRFVDLRPHCRACRLQLPVRHPYHAGAPLYFRIRRCDRRRRDAAHPLPIVPPRLRRAGARRR